MGRKSIAWWHPENIDNHELVKVRITNKVSNYRVGAVTYMPGDVVEVPEFAICDFMARVVEVPVAVAAEEVTEEPVEETQPKTTTKKRTAKKKVTEPEPAPEDEAVDTSEESS